MGRQQEIWNQEHTDASIFTGIHKERPSPPVLDFTNFLLEQGGDPRDIRVCDLGCGGGRNSFLLAANLFQVTSLDFSAAAIKKAKLRAEELGMSINFREADLGKPWQLNDGELTALVDCNTTICIPNSDRMFALSEAQRVLKSGGFYLLYAVGRTSFCDLYPGTEPNSTIFPKSGHFEKQYTKEEILETYKDFDVVKLEERKGKDIIEGKEIEFSTWVGIFRKR